MDTHYLNEVINGNTNAFGYFIRTYQNKAFGIAISIVKQEDDAKDVVQNSFITAYSSISKFRNDAKFSTWFYRIVVNTALQFLAQRKRNVIKNEALELTETEKTACNAVIQKMHQDDLKRLIKTVFSKIHSKQALILQLFYIDELSITEIEEVTNFTKPNIKVLLHRGRTSFYDIVKKQHIKKP
ncbi:RNA polymerase sigma factor [Winogradskyella sp. R77965]|uniref:RNA polymerase sigma factor n=1 Tax=Winogradskyella sp. R77965 TaxID=3093872 RepID=UPI0037DDBA6D